jgi:D-alanyl-D-alanine carboxypeptidase/D-alanyl-D-alanine-endopeptidase (penicillin-binding protein 4)
MRCWLLLVLISMCRFTARSQSVPQQLQQRFQQFEQDSQLKFAISSLHVINAKTGQVVFSKNEKIGLAPASTQKLITAAAAFAILGKDFRYTTRIGILQQANDKFLVIYPSGDPSFGSWRWNNTKESEILRDILPLLKTEDLKECKAVIVAAAGWNEESIPSGWIWEDIGNYYGAGAHVLNWRENQFDLYLSSGKSIGDPVTIVGTDPQLCAYRIRSEAKAAGKGSGDNAYIFLPTASTDATLRGTIPINQQRFRISGSILNPANQFISTLLDSIRQRTGWTPSEQHYSFQPVTDPSSLLYTHTSPSLDSIIYWFNRKSINLYGESLIRTIALTKTGNASPDTGLALIKDFWKQKGIDRDELNMSDGSGLSPQNRITTRAHVAILKYARTQEWFEAFYESLPEYNGMKMKSGTIRNVKGFAGYHTSRQGNEYIFSFLVNNYNGSASSLVSKMYRVLDVLK